MGKRGQITIFIIVGIVVLIIIAAFLVFANRGIEDAQEEVIDISPMQSFAEACFKKTIEDGLFEAIGKQGGYANLEGIRFEEVNHQKIVYHEKPEAPSAEMIQEQLDGYVRENFPKCLDLTSYREYELRKPNSFTTNFQIQEENVIGDVEYLLELRRGDAKAQLKGISIEIPVRVKKTRDIGECYHRKIAEDSDELTVFLARKACNNDELITVNLVENKYVLVYDYSSWYNKFGKTFKYQFAVNLK